MDHIVIGLLYFLTIRMYYRHIFSDALWLTAFHHCNFYDLDFDLVTFDP